MSGPGTSWFDKLTTNGLESVRPEPAGDVSRPGTSWFDKLTMNGLESVRPEPVEGREPAGDVMVRQAHHERAGSPFVLSLSKDVSRPGTSWFDKLTMNGLVVRSS